jgi:energy-coupling factor transporter ATP-binding protein EcfA2
VCVCLSVFPGRCLTSVRVACRAVQVGIVGRTGSGKSSLIISLFRIVEPYQGTITMDGINLLDLGLDDVRSRIAAIPQVRAPGGSASEPPSGSAPGAGWTADRQMGSLAARTSVGCKRAPLPRKACLPRRLGRQVRRRSWV